MEKIKITEGKSLPSCPRKNTEITNKVYQRAKQFVSHILSCCVSFHEVINTINDQEDFSFILHQCLKVKYIRLVEKHTQEVVAFLQISETIFSSCIAQDVPLIEQAFQRSISTQKIIHIEKNSPINEDRSTTTSTPNMDNTTNMKNTENDNDFPGGLLKNTSFLGKIVDITKVDPVSISTSLTGVNALNFDVTEETALPTSDGRFGIPPGTKFEPIFSTDVSVDTSVFQENTDIYEKFSASVSFGEDEKSQELLFYTSNDDDKKEEEEEQDKNESKGSAFSVSMTCEFITQNTSENKHVVTHSSATHKLYVLRQNIAYDLKKLVVDDEFQFWITKKLNADNPSTFTDFINKVGTHYITSVLYGGVGFQVLKIDTETVTKLQEQHVSISAAAKEVMLRASASHDTKDTYSSFTETTTSKTVFIGGTILPHLSEDKTLDFTDWSESVINEPAAVSINVERVTLLLTSDYFPDMDQDQLQKIKNGLGQAISAYLKAHPRPSSEPGQVVMLNNYYYMPVGFVQKDSPYRAINGHYDEYWSNGTYSFPTLTEGPPKKFAINSTFNHVVRPLLHGSEITISYVDFPLLYDSNSCQISWYGTYPQAYYDQPYSNHGYTWIIEKVSTNIDDTIRDGDPIRIRKSGTKEYIATTPLNDGLSTLTWTTDPQNAEFIIKILPGNK